MFPFITHTWNPVAVGMDNYGNGFPEPSLEKTMQLIEELEFNRGIKVFRKTLREFGT